MFSPGKKQTSIRVKCSHLRKPSDHTDLPRQAHRLSSRPLLAAAGLRGHHLRLERDGCEQNINVVHCLLRVKGYVLIFNSGNEKTEGILPQIGHGGAWRHQGGDWFCKTALRPPPEW